MAHIMEHMFFLTSHTDADIWVSTNNLLTHIQKCFIKLKRNQLFTVV